MNAELLSPVENAAIRGSAFVCVVATYGLAITVAMSPVVPTILEDEWDGAFVVELAPIAATIPTPPVELPMGPSAIDAAETPRSAPATATAEPRVDPELPRLPTQADASDALAAMKPAEKPTEEPTEEMEPAEQGPNAAVLAPSNASDVAAPPRIADVPVAPKTAAPHVGTSSRNRTAVANWKTSLVLHLNKFKRFPRAARGAEPDKPITVRFRVDRTGKVLDAEVVAASGIAPLDQEARDMVLRASPMPRPPAASPDDIHVFVVPVLFKRR
jgi:protein TonB